MARDVRVAILGDSRDFSRAVRQANDDAGKLHQRLGGVAGGFAKFGKAAALGLGGLAVGGVALGKGFIDAAVESQKVTKQTEAVIKSMGGASKVTAKQVADLSESLSMATGVDDELIQSGQNVLLTFGKVRNEVGKGNDIFNQATKAALDMSVALGTDMNQASLMVGKALNDPVKGLTALRRSGIQFTKQQEDQIKAMVKAGDVAGAQKIMLAELQAQFGGSAEAQATAGDRLKVVWGNLQEELGARLLPAAEAVAAFLAKNLPKAMAFAGKALRPLGRQLSMFWKTLTSGFTEDEGTPIERFALKVREALQAVAGLAQQWGPRVGAALKTVGEFLSGTLLPAFVRLGSWVKENQPVLIGLSVAIGTGLVAAFLSWAASAAAAAVATLAAAAPIILVGAAIAALVAGVIYAYQNWDWFRGAVQKVAAFFTGTFVPLLKSVASWFTGTLIPTIGAVAAKFAEAVGFIKRNWQTILAILTGPIGLAVLAISKHKDSIIKFFQAIPGAIKSAFSSLANTITSPFRSAFDAIRGLWNSTIGGFGFNVGGWDPPGPGPKVPGFSFRIPRMHTGGIVSGVGEQLRILKAGEGVFTPDQMRALGRGTAAFPSHVTLVVDGQQFAARIVADGSAVASRRGFAS